MRTIKLGLVGTLILVFVWLLPLVASAQTGAQTGISFTPSTQQINPGAIQANQHIPNGQIPRQLVSSQANTAHLTGELKKTLQTGKLPQTAEAYTWYVRICGGLLLFSLVLGYFLWRDVRKVKRGSMG